eukprot:TRINITY_DN22229_c0_g1_i1.p1 TRINITY_DN22229_c0_g1~~TRINITY_DN22229_c0_g1_i1.p1  ORF type:complete len:550 (+),score=228.90 TRINITY_DN22229_c0_g1_i1:51-1700(+)
MGNCCAKDAGPPAKKAAPGPQQAPRGEKEPAPMSPVDGESDGDDDGDIDDEENSKATKVDVAISSAMKPTNVIRELAEKLGGYDELQKQMELFSKSKAGTKYTEPLTKKNVKEAAASDMVVSYKLKTAPKKGKGAGAEKVVDYRECQVLGYNAKTGMVTVMTAKGQKKDISLMDMIDPVVHKSSLASERNVKKLGEWICAEWKKKKGTVLTELCENLARPDEMKGKESSIISKSAHLLRRRTKNELGYELIELFVMALYTMAGPDEDIMMQFKDVPKKRKDWGGYTPRNKPMFAEINSALRAAGTVQEFDATQWPCSELKKWCKTIVLLTALASEKNKVGNGKYSLSRGLAGLPDGVMADHTRLDRGGSIIWTAPSSCALDPAVSKAYLEGNATNATKSTGGKIMFQVLSTHGVPLQRVSKYPKEAEVLLPPITELNLLKVDAPDGYLQLSVAANFKLLQKQMQPTLDEAQREAATVSKMLTDRHYRLRKKRRATQVRAIDPNANVLRSTVATRNQQKDKFERSGYDEAEASGLGMSRTGAQKNGSWTA